MEIVFKNGTVLEVHQSVVDVISEKLPKGATQFQTFSFNDGPTSLVINIEDISFIHDNTLNKRTLLK